MEIVFYAVLGVVALLAIIYYLWESTTDWHAQPKIKVSPPITPRVKRHSAKRRSKVSRDEFFSDYE